MNRKQLIEDNMNLVYYLAHTYYPKYAKDEDIIQSGMVGLCRAAETWDESKSKFSTYASRAILNEFTKEFKSRRQSLNTLSLDYEMGEENATFGELLVGEKDVLYVDLKELYAELTPRERECFELLREGWRPIDIAKKLGISRQHVNYHLRQIRLRWRKIYGD